MPKMMALLQIVIGLQTCKTKGEARMLLEDVYELGRRAGVKSQNRVM